MIIDRRLSESILEGPTRKEGFHFLMASYSCPENSIRGLIRDLQLYMIKYNLPNNLSQCPKNGPTMGTLQWVFVDARRACICQQYLLCTAPTLILHLNGSVSVASYPTHKAGEKKRLQTLQHCSMTKPCQEGHERKACV